MGFIIFRDYEKQSREALQNRREELRKAYEEYKEYQKLQSSWYGRVYTGIQDYASGLLKTIKASISFGEEIYMPQNPIESSIESFKNSTSIDQIYSWTGYNGLAYSISKKWYWYMETKASRQSQ